MVSCPVVSIGVAAVLPLQAPVPGHQTPLRRSVPSIVGFRLPTMPQDENTADAFVIV